MRPPPRAPDGSPRQVTRSRAARRRLLLVCDGVAQQPDAVDLDLDDVARLHPQRRGSAGADAARRARHDDVARLEPREFRAILDLARDIENHLADGRVLHDLAVETGLQPQRAEIAGLVRRHQPRTECAGIRKILARRELMRVALVVADAALVVTGVTRDMAPAIFL